MVDAILDVAIHEGSEIIDSVVDTMVGDASLRIVVRPDFCRTVAGANHRLTLAGDIIDIFLMFFIVDESTETREGTLLVLGLVARLGTFDEDFLHFSGIGVLPVINNAGGRRTRPY